MKLNPDYMRNIVFGAEDSLVSTTGVLFGIATSSASRSSILVTGLVLIAVESISMGAGAFLSESSEHEITAKKVHKDSTIVDGILMFFSYSITGFLVLLPYLITNIKTGKFLSVLVALNSLFLLGFLPKKSIRSAFRMLIVAGLALFAGYVIGASFETL